MSYRATDRFENWFITSLQTGINDTTSSFRLNDNLNVKQARLVIDPYDPSVREVVKVTSVDGNLVYVERGDDNTVPQYHLEGAIVALNVVAADMNDLYADWDDTKTTVLDAVDAANTATAEANTATAAANTATSNANAATSAANTATGLANTATSNANAATSAANNAASSANTAAAEANTEAGRASDAADAAEAVVDDVASAARSALSPDIQFSGGNVGIGKAPASGRKLDVAGDIYSNGVKMSGAPDFSTTEQTTGQKWIDGKTIYVRAFTGSITATQLNEHTLPFNVTGIAKIVDVKGFFALGASGIIYLVNSPSGGSRYGSVSFNPTTNQIRLHTRVDFNRTNEPFEFAVYYTKA